MSMDNALVDMQNHAASNPNNKVEASLLAAGYSKCLFRGPLVKSKLIAPLRLGPPKPVI